MSDRILKVAQIGCGYWGPNLLRNFSAAKHCTVKYVVDSDPARQEYVKKHYPHVCTLSGLEPLWEDAEVAAVIVATPANSHYSLAMSALRAGKHVFVEKPLAMTVYEVDQLIEEARRQQRILMVGHTFLFNPAVRHLKKLIESGELGQTFYFYSQRLNLGQVRSDVNAWWNLAPHDVSVLLYLMDGRLPTTAVATGTAYLQKGIEDVVFATLTWSEKVTASIHVSWLDPHKIRRLTVVGSRKMVVYDDVSENKIVVFDKGFDKVPKAGEVMDYDDLDSFRLRHRAGDILMPHVRFEEPLQVEAAHFIECVRTGQEPLTGGDHARRVVAVLEAAQSSLRAHGNPVIVSAD